MAFLKWKNRSKFAREHGGFSQSLSHIYTYVYIYILFFCTPQIETKLREGIYHF